MQTPGDDFMSYQQKAAHYLNRRIRKYEFTGIEELLNSDYRIDGRVSDTGMSGYDAAKIECDNVTEFSLTVAGSTWFKTETLAEYGYGKAFPAGVYRAVVTAECIAI